MPALDASKIMITRAGPDFGGYDLWIFNNTYGLHMIIVDRFQRNKKEGTNLIYNTFNTTESKSFNFLFDKSQINLKIVNCNR